MDGVNRLRRLRNALYCGAAHIPLETFGKLLTEIRSSLKEGRGQKGEEKTALSQRFTPTTPLPAKN